MAQTDTLPSRNDGAAKEAITKFIQVTTTPGRKFAAPEARAATFDHVARVPLATVPLRPDD